MVIANANALVTNSGIGATPDVDEIYGTTADI